MTRTQLGMHKRMLEIRLQEFSNTLGKRQNIAVERAPDAVDDLELAGERDVAIWSLERHFAQLRFVEAALDRIAGHGTGRIDRRLVEYWAHEASLIPIEIHPLFRWRMDERHRIWAGMRRVLNERQELIAVSSAVITENASALAISAPLCVRIVALQTAS